MRRDKEARMLTLESVPAGGGRGSEVANLFGQRINRHKSPVGGHLWSSVLWFKNQGTMDINPELGNNS